MKLSSDCGREGIRTAEGGSSAAASREVEIPRWIAFRISLSEIDRLFSL